MKLLRSIIYIFILVICAIKSFAQPISRYNTFNYSVNEGLLQTTIGDIAIDQNNFCWISFPKGIQKFDGKNFTNIPLQPGLPDDKFVKFFSCKNGDLLLTHTVGISKYEITSNSFVTIYNNPKGVNNPVIFIGEEEGIIYFYSENGSISGINSTTYKLLSETKTEQLVHNTEYLPKFSDNIINHKVGININYKLYLWDLKLNRMLATSDVVPYMSIYFLRLKTEHEILYNTYKVNTALQLYNFITKKRKSLFITGKDDKQFGRINILSWNNRLLISFNNRLFETDTTFTRLKTELVDFQNQPIAGTSSISGAGIKEDHYSNLYIQTVNSGIKKVIGNNYPLKYYGTIKKEENNIISLLPDKKNNHILVGTFGNGLLVFDTFQRLIKHIKRLPGEKQIFSTNTIIKNNKEEYLLFNVGEKKVWVLKNDFSAMISVPLFSPLPENKKGFSYFGNFLFQNQTGALTQSQGKLYKTDFAANTVSEHEMSNAYIMGGLLYNNFIITHANDELIFLDASTFAVIKKIPFKNTGNIRCFTVDKNNNIYAGSNNGIFILEDNGKILQHLTKENGLPDNCIYAMVFDDEGYLWCSTNKGIFRLNKDNSILLLKKEDGLQENEFNTNVVAKSADGELFFGGVNGVSSFYPSAIGNFEKKINIFFTKIKANNDDVIKDTAAWNITAIQLPYTRNNLSFDFVAMGSSNPEQYIYQYKMEEVDKEWIQKNDLQTVRYSLPPGKYIFKIYASRSFDKDAKPLKEVRIIIHPPFWKSWWFVLLWILLFGTLIGYMINRFNKRKFQKKMQEILNQQKIQTERERISRDLHDSVGAFANAVLYKTELLDKEIEPSERKELMQDLKFASKDIITSLRETVWALKKDSYTSEDCLVRLRNFIQPLAKYYSNINFKIDVVAPDHLNFHYTKALNLIRIIQEAVSNSIKHAKAKNIQIISTIENGKWKITVIDDGIGFDYRIEKETETGNGLVNMERRAKESGFTLEIKTGNDKHTSVSVLT